MTGALDCHSQLTLMARASAGYSAGQNLCSLRDKTAQFCDILIIDGFDLIYAEAANLLAAFASGPLRRSAEIRAHSHSWLWSRPEPVSYTHLGFFPPQAVRVSSSSALSSAQRIRFMEMFSFRGFRIFRRSARRDRKSTRLNSSHSGESRMPSSA